MRSCSASARSWPSSAVRDARRGRGRASVRRARRPAAAGGPTPAMHRDVGARGDERRRPGARPCSRCGRRRSGAGSCRGRASPLPDCGRGAGPDTGRAARRGAGTLPRRAGRGRRRRLLQQRGRAARVRRAARRDAATSTWSSSTAPRRTTASPASPTCRSTTIPLPRTAASRTAATPAGGAATAPYVLFLNPDATIDRRLARAAGRGRRGADPRVGAVAPRIVEPDGTLDFSLRRFPRLRSTYAQALFLHRLFPRRDVDGRARSATRPRTSGPARREWASGACLLVRRSALERARRARRRLLPLLRGHRPLPAAARRGLDIRFEPAATVVHDGGASAPAGGAAAGARGEPRALRAQAPARRTWRCSSGSASRSARSRTRSSPAAARQRAAAGCARSRARCHRARGQASSSASPRPALGLVRGRAPPRRARG